MFAVSPNFSKNKYRIALIVSNLSSMVIPEKLNFPIS
jgi:hypothetical protein